MRPLLLLPVLALSAAAQVPNAIPHSAEEAAQLEKTVDQKPEMYSLRSSLLTYYSRATDMPADAVKEARRRHILWLIANHPEDSAFTTRVAEITEKGGRLADPEGFQAAQKLWREQGSKDDALPIVVTRAAEVFAISDPDFAFEILGKGLKRSPNNQSMSEMEGVLDAFSLTGVSALLIRDGLNGIDSAGLATAFSRDPDSANARRARQELQSTDNPNILTGAAVMLGQQYSNFRRLKPDRAAGIFDLTERCFQKALKLDPDDKRLTDRMVSFYVSAAVGSPPAERVRLLEKGLTHARTIEARENDLEWLCTAHFEAGAIDDAASEAKELLEIASGMAKSDFRNATGTHEANIVLGRVALKKNDAAEAKARLLAAGKVPGAPTLNSFGPKWTLAQELLDRGERDAVLEYIAECQTFWKSGSARMKKWDEAIRDGGNPDFNARASVVIQDLTGKTAAPFKLARLGAASDAPAVALDDYKGKVLVLDFWATWCGPCRRELPSFEKLSKESAGQDVVVLTVNMAESADTVAQFMKEAKYTFPVLLSEDKAMPEKYGVAAIPTTVVIDKTGKIVDYHVGVQEEDKIRAAIEKGRAGQ